MKLDRLQRALQTGNWGQAADILGLLVAGADPHPSMMYNYVSTMETLYNRINWI